MTAGRHGEHSRGRGPNPPVPSAQQAEEAVERLLEDVLQVAGDDELVNIPDQTDLMGILRYHRTLYQQRRETPRDQALADRATLTRFVLDQVDHEDLHTLREMRRVKMPDSRQSASYGYQHRNAARRKLVALENRLSSGYRAQSGETHRAPRTGSGHARTAARQKAQERWINDHRVRFETVVDQFMGVAPAAGVSAGSLEDLRDEVEEARCMTGTWAGVVPYLRIALSEASVPATSDASEVRSSIGPSPLTRAKLLLDDLDRGCEETPGLVRGASQRTRRPSR